MQKSIIRFRVQMKRKKNLIIIQRDGGKTTISWKLPHKKHEKKISIANSREGACKTLTKLIKFAGESRTERAEKMI